MRWVPQDIEMFVNAKEYVDTVVIPLFPVSFGDDINQTANMTEFINLLTLQLERQFKGRLILLPGFTYFKNEEKSKLLSNLLEWENKMKLENFKHIFYVTSDSDWKINEQNISGSLLWLPALPLIHMEDKQKNSLIEDQVKQLINLFVQRWHQE